MQATAKRVIEQLVVDNSFEEALATFSKSSVVQALERSIALARSNYFKQRAERLSFVPKRRTSDSERWSKKEIAVLEQRLKDVRAKADWDAKEVLDEHLLKKWAGGAFSGLLFDRGRSTIMRHLEAIEKIEAALKEHKAVPIEVDDSGEGSYSGWAFGVYRSLDEWVAKFGDRWLCTPRNLKSWQWLAGVVAWSRPESKLRGDPLVQACEPGWHWLKFDDTRTSV